MQMILKNKTDIIGNNFPTKITSITNLYSVERKRAEEFIEDNFALVYGAEIKEHYPTLMSVRDENDNILACLGFRYANNEPLFLEQYLSDSIENKTKINRNNIVEVGNLSANGGGNLLFLFMALNSYLKQQGFKYVTATATNSLRKYFKRIGLRPTIISDVNHRLLTDNGASWGSYYGNNSKIIIGDITNGYDKLQSKLNLNRDLFPRIHKQIKTK